MYWLTNWVIGFAAWMAGINSTQLAKIEKSLPATAKLIKIIDELQPTIQKALPLIDQAIVEWKQVGPAVQIVVDVLNRDLNKGKDRATSIADAMKKLEG